MFAYVSEFLEGPMNVQRLNEQVKALTAKIAKFVPFELEKGNEEATMLRSLEDFTSSGEQILKLVLGQHKKVKRLVGASPSGVQLRSIKFKSSCISYTPSLQTSLSTCADQADGAPDLDSVDASASQAFTLTQRALFTLTSAHYLSAHLAGVCLSQTDKNLAALGECESSNLLKVTYQKANLVIERLNVDQDKGTAEGTGLCLTAQSKQAVGWAKCGTARADQQWAPKILLF